MLIYLTAYSIITPDIVLISLRQLHSTMLRHAGSLVSLVLVSLCVTPGDGDSWGLLGLLGLLGTPGEGCLNIFFPAPPPPPPTNPPGQIPYIFFGWAEPRPGLTSLQSEPKGKRDKIDLLICFPQNRVLHTILRAFNLMKMMKMREHLLCQKHQKNVQVRDSSNKHGKAPIKHLKQKTNVLL